ncbi:MAG: arylsulfatase [Planctomycetes bacterium]|nr:arylsulfatase [Planctomycetota bacterium]
MMGAMLAPPVIACMFLSTVAPLTAQERRQPNILILYADDLGYGDLGVQNSGSKIPTPNLDRLAREGVRFTDGHSSSGICSPSRYALLTGRYHWRDFHGIVGPFGPSKFPSERLTMPEMLQAEGYDTACIGKWHLGWDWDAIKKRGAEPIRRKNRETWGPEAFDWTKPIPDGPLAHGFDHYFGDSVINFPPYCWILDDKVVQAPDTFMDTSKWKKIKEGRWECRPGPMITGWDPFQNLPALTEKGVDYIRARKGLEEPFFLYLAFPSPHAPIIPTDRFDGRSEAGPYGDYVVETDDACGRILAALEQSGQAADTIVIFTADNGPEHYAYARDEEFGHWSSQPFRGLKRDIYEGGHHVPFLIRWPGVVEAGRTCDALVSQVDLMATLAAVVDFELPDEAAEDSHDLLPVLSGEAETVRTSHVHNTRENEYAIRSGDWLLVAANSGYVSRRDAAWEARRDVPADDDGPVELYDLSEDVGQRRNLAREHPERVSELRALLEEIRTEGHSAPRLSAR